MNAIINGRLIVPDATGDFTELKNGAIVFAENILAVCPIDEWQKRRKDFPQLSDEDIFDARHNFVAPGFINLHIHGAVGCDAMDATTSALRKISAFQAQTGVTAFLPTTMTCPKDKIFAALSAIRAAKNLRDGATILGAHLEGPFISEQYKGAQAAADILSADFSLVAPFADTIKILTFAPETMTDEVLDDFLRKLRENGIVPSIGHTAADEATAHRALALGAKSFTHLFNAMSGVHHRKGGTALAALTTDATAEIIADNVHVSPAAQKLMWRAKGGKNIALITDSLRACGMGDGVSELGGQEVFVKGNLATLKDGTIAGSVLTLDRGVKNFWQNTEGALPQIIETVTKTPAQLLGEYAHFGSLEAGKRADIVIFDEEINLKATIVGGKKVYSPYWH